MRFLRHVPNALSLLRLALSVVLFAIPFGSLVFIALYLACGLTDALDGYLARRLRAVTPLGARLDSAGDFVFFAMYVWVAFRLPNALASGMRLSGLIACTCACVALVALLRVASLAVIWKRTGVPGFIHTYANKAAGITLFALLPAIAILGLTSPVASACVIVTLSLCLVSAVEELLVAVLVTPVDLDRKGLFLRARAR
jgi:CDP-diacylglycerol--glycerol-3-phosphate 3-phosphatidyltransferase